MINTVFHELERRLQGVNAADLVEQAIMGSETELITDLRDSLFDKSKKTNGEQLQRYRPRTRDKKIKEGLPSRNYTLFDTGKLHASFKLESDGQSVKTVYGPIYGDIFKKKRTKKNRRGVGPDVYNISIKNNFDLLVAKLKKSLFKRLVK